MKTKRPETVVSRRKLLQFVSSEDLTWPRGIFAAKTRALLKMAWQEGAGGVVLLHRKALYSFGP